MMIEIYLPEPRSGAVLLGMIANNCWLWHNYIRLATYMDWLRRTPRQAKFHTTAGRAVLWTITRRLALAFLLTGVFSLWVLYSDLFNRVGNEFTARLTALLWG